MYDGTTSDTVTLYANPIAGDSVNASYTSASFSDAFVGSNKPVSVVGIAIAGADAGNYSSNTTAATTASITPSGGTPNPPVIPVELAVVPILPLGTSNQAPIALQEDMSSGVFTANIIPDMPSNPSIGTLLTYRQSANQSNLLVVANPQRGPEILSLFPAPVIKPTSPIAPIAPILVPKPSRN